MKKYTLLIVWLISIGIKVYAQNFSEPMPSHDYPQTTGFQHADAIPELGHIPLKNDEQSKKLTTPYYQQKSKTQKINGLVLITGGSVMSFFGIRPALDFSNRYFYTTSSLHNLKNKNMGSSRLALTGLVMVAGSIPYFISSLKNKKLGGLKFACQKTSFGASNKARKKVTGLTFAIQIGK